MATKTKTKIKNYDVSKTLVIIEKDSDLNDMFRKKFGTSYKMIHATINSGAIKPKAEKYIKDLFDKIISKREELIVGYNSLDNAPKKATKKTVSKKGVEPSKLNNKKRWGLQAITQDIAENFNGKPTQTHRTGKKVQVLKKIFARLEVRMFNVRFTKKTLTDKQLRELGGAIDTFNKKVDSIVNAKKKK